MKKFKRYMVWESEQYYPGAGLDDFLDSFDTLHEAKDWITKRNEKKSHKWRGIFDRIEGVEIE